MSIDKLKTVYSTGTFINNVKTFFKKINEIIDWINNIGSTTIPDYKVYRALLTQTGTSAPTATILEDTINGITWNYDGVGQYYANITPYTSILILIGDSDIGNKSNVIQAYDNLGSGVFIDTSNTGVGGNNILSNTSIQIIIYN